MGNNQNRSTRLREQHQRSQPSSGWILLQTDAGAAASQPGRGQLPSLVQEMWAAMGRRDLEQLLLLGHLPQGHLLVPHPASPLSCRGCTSHGFWDISLFYGVQLEPGASTQ